METSSLQPKLWVEPESVGPAGSVNVCWSGVQQHNSYGWIGLYASPSAADNGYITFKYITPGAAGSQSFIMPDGASATYEFRFFPTGGYDKKATSGSVTVNPPPPVKLNVEPKSVGPEGTVTVSWSDAPKASAAGWIGLYDKASAADTSYLTYKYLGAASASGSLSFSMPEIASTTYEFRFFPAGQYDVNKVVSGSVTVSPPPPVTLVAEPVTVARGGIVSVSWAEARKPSTSGWIGLYASSSAADNAYLTYKYITATASGSLNFPMPDAVGESYEFRLFPSGGYDKKATTRAVSVTEPHKQVVLTPEQVAELQKKLAEKTEELTERNKRITELEAELRQCAACQDKLAAQEKAAAAMVEELKQCARCQDALAAQTQKLRALEAEHLKCAGNRDKLAELERTVAGMAEELTKRGDCQEKLVQHEKTIATLQAQVQACADCEQKLGEQEKTIGILEQKLAQAQPPAKKAKPDDLKVIEGIGPKIAELLTAGGIATFNQLATAEPSRIQAILVSGGPRFALADPTSWPAQAKLAASGHWDELTALQSKLRAGRKS